MIRSGALAMPFRIGFGPFAKFLGANGVMEAIHKKHVPEPHWYLMIVGVDTELQGRGAGTALVKGGIGAGGRDEPNVLPRDERRAKSRILPTAGLRGATECYPWAWRPSRLGHAPRTKEFELTLGGSRYTGMARTRQA
jgi:hypothetical protein